MNKIQKYTYTVIIPHHNTPDLLNRCINSIPLRDDIQIIVVDDNSLPTKQPAIHRANLLLLKVSESESKWAGHARNIGLQHALGKWLLFADADDFYKKGAFEVFDKYSQNQDFEVLYFNAFSVDSETLSPSCRTKELNTAIEDFLDNKTPIDVIKYRIKAPWFKMVRKSFIDKFHIRFEEIRKGNDMFFTYQVGFFSKKYSVIRDKVYVCTYSTSSMTYSKYTKEVYLCTLQSLFRNNAFYAYIGHPEWKQSLLRYLGAIIKKEGLCFFFSYVFSVLRNVKSIIESRGFYIEMLHKRDQ